MDIRGYLFWICIIDGMGHHYLCFNRDSKVGRRVKSFILKESFHCTLTRDCWPRKAVAKTGGRQELNGSGWWEVQSWFDPKFVMRTEIRTYMFVDWFWFWLCSWDKNSRIPSWLNSLCLQAHVTRLLICGAENWTQVILGLTWALCQMNPSPSPRMKMKNTISYQRNPGHLWLLVTRSPVWLLGLTFQMGYYR